MTLEIQGATTYWHSQNKKTVYPEVLAKNKCIGMKWSDKVVEATWFGPNSTVQTETRMLLPTWLLVLILVIFLAFLVILSCRHGIHPRH